MSDAGTPTLSAFLDDHPFAAGEPVIASDDGPMTLGELRARVTALAEATDAGLRPRHAVAALVSPGPSAIVVMFAVWAAGAAYLPSTAGSRPRRAPRSPRRTSPPC
jgi:acyl-coenzyme A synthetase/AMP-(fatty) acid ligase